MAYNWTDAQIDEVVKSVVETLKDSKPQGEYGATHYGGRKFVGIFEDMNDAITAAADGYKLIRAMSLKEREKIIDKIK